MESDRLNKKALSGPEIALIWVEYNFSNAESVKKDCL